MWPKKTQATGQSFPFTAKSSFVVVAYIWKPPACPALQN